MWTITGPFDALEKNDSSIKSQFAQDVCTELVAYKDRDEAAQDKLPIYLGKKGPTTCSQ